MPSSMLNTRLPSPSFVASPSSSVESGVGSLPLASTVTKACAGAVDREVIGDRQLTMSDSDRGRSAACERRSESIVSAPPTRFVAKIASRSGTLTPSLRSTVSLSVLTVTSANSRRSSSGSSRRWRPQGLSSDGLPPGSVTMQWEPLVPRVSSHSGLLSSVCGIIKTPWTPCAEYRALGSWRSPRGDKTPWAGERFT